MGFQTEAKKVDLNDIKTNVKSTTEDVEGFVSQNRKDSENMSSSNDILYSGFGFGFGGKVFDTTGIQASKVPAMQDAIKAYVNKLRSHLDGIDSNAPTKNAFAGAYAKATSEFVDRLKESCQNIISNLLMFSDKLEEIKNAYAARAESMQGDITDQSAKMASSFTEYQAKN